MALRLESASCEALNSMGNLHGNRRRRHFSRAVERAQDRRPEGALQARGHLGAAYPRPDGGPDARACAVQPRHRQQAARMRPDGLAVRRRRHEAGLDRGAGGRGSHSRNRCRAGSGSPPCWSCRRSCSTASSCSAGSRHDVRPNCGTRPGTAPQAGTPPAVLYCVRRCQLKFQATQSTPPAPMANTHPVPTPPTSSPAIATPTD